MPSSAATADLSATAPRRSVLRDGALLLLGCVVFTALFIALAAAALTRPKAQVQQEIHANFTAGALIPQVYVAPDARRGRYLTNDCFILETLAFGSGPLLADVVNSTTVDPGTTGACATLHDAVQPGAPAPKTYLYSRYFWAAKAFIAHPMAWASLDAIKSTLRAAVYAVLALAAAVAAWRLARGGPQPRGVYVTVLASALGLFVLYDLWHYAVTLAHGFAELVLAGFLLHAAAARPAPPQAFGWRWVVLGALTAWFELLSGPMVLAAGLAALVAQAQGGPRLALRAGLLTACAVVGSLLVLQLFVLAFGDPANVAQFFYHAALRMQLHHVLPIPVEAGWQMAENSRSYTFGDVLRAVGAELPRLTYDHAGAARWVFGASAAALAAAAAAGLATGRAAQISMYLVVPLGVVAWYLVFSNHTVIHAWGMVRIMVLLPVCGLLATLRWCLPPAWWETAR